jgi:hypothetical protein
MNSWLRIMWEISCYKAKGRKVSPFHHPTIMIVSARTLARYYAKWASCNIDRFEAESCSANYSGCLLLEVLSDFMQIIYPLLHNHNLTLILKEVAWHYRSLLYLLAGTTLEDQRSNCQICDLWWYMTTSPAGVVLDGSIIRRRRGRNRVRAKMKYSDQNRNPKQPETLVFSSWHRLTLFPCIHSPKTQ